MLKKTLQGLENITRVPDGAEWYVINVDERRCNNNPKNVVNYNGFVKSSKTLRLLLSELLTGSNCFQLGYKNYLHVVMTSNKISISYWQVRCSSKLISCIFEVC